MYVAYIINTKCVLCQKKVKNGKGHTFDTAHLSEGTSLQKRTGMTRVVKGFHLHTHAFIHEWNEPYLSFWRVLKYSESEWEVRYYTL